MTRAPQTIPVFYTHRMLADLESLSPSAHKPWPVVQSWSALGVPLSILPPTPVTRDQLSLAHDLRFVSDILECRAKNGFYTQARDVAESLPYTNGAILSTAREAIRSKGVAVAPTCGFHHAGYAKADAFCTFNGLMVAALVLKREGVVQRVGILDLDMHYGDGTENIIQALRVEKFVFPTKSRNAPGDPASLTCGAPRRGCETGSRKIQGNLGRRSTGASI